MRWCRSLVAGVVLLLGVATVGLAQQKLKAGFIYIGPIGDYGWTHAHDQARQVVQQAFPWLETVYVESVPEGQVETFIEQMVRQGIRVIFTTSFGYMDGTLAAARRYPEVLFAHASGFKRAPNVATYMADFYQLYYLNGLHSSPTGRVLLFAVKCASTGVYISLGIAKGESTCPESGFSYRVSSASLIGGGYMPRWW